MVKELLGWMVVQEFVTEERREKAPSSIIGEKGDVMSGSITCDGREHNV